MDHRVTKSSGIGTYEFGMICPALLYLADGKTCILRNEDILERPPAAGIWGYGFMAITMISALSMLGAVLVPLITKQVFDVVLVGLVSAAAGALCGDAMLHLIPHSQSSSHSESNEPIWTNLTVLGGIYLLFVVEKIVVLLQIRKKSKMLQNESPASSEDDIIQPGRGGSAACDEENQNEIEEDAQENEHERNTKHSHAHDHDHGDLAEKGIASMAWMVIAGDGMHNFSDGVAIGAAFSANIIGGWSTSIAVFCHELPHELGDFAMLVKSGMTVKQALIFNGLAGVLGYLGMILGIVIGNYASGVTPWIFACTAGMFLYVALVDMIPEMNSGIEELSFRRALSLVILQNIGFLSGIALMLLISVFEEKIELAQK